MVVRVKLGDDEQIAIPPLVQKQLGVRRGDYLLIEPRDGYAVILPEPGSYVERLRGLHREVWADTDPDRYLNQERDAWQT